MKKAKSRTKAVSQMSRSVVQTPVRPAPWIAIWALLTAIILTATRWPGLTGTLDAPLRFGLTVTEALVAGFPILVIGSKWQLWPSVRPNRLLSAAVRALLIGVVLVGTISPGSAYARDSLPDSKDADQDGDEIVEALKKIGQVVIDIFIGIAAILMAVGIATGFVGGQFMVTVGQPYGLSQAWVKVIAVVLLGIGAMLTIVIANTIINIMAGLVPPTVIPTV